MRWLIGVYLVLGFGQMGLSLWIGALAIQDWLAPTLGPQQPWQESFFMVAAGFVIGLLSLFAAYGLWKRWRLVRLILLGLSWWALAVCAFAASVALAMVVGWTDGRALGITDPPGITLSIAFALASWPALHFWVLWPSSEFKRPATRAEQR
ncbi:MAG TPA: hypothetical protein VFA18_03695 [Gemmataceae bacterium]|nr:hypothetical protein [Gemmataceae bacterium]